MKQSGPLARQLYEKIKAYALDQRSAQLRKLCRRIEQHKVTEQQARLRLRKIEPLIERQKLIGNYLPRAPESEELYGKLGPPQIPFGELVDNATGVRVGGYLKGLCQSWIVSGRSGCGKTTQERVMIHHALSYANQTGYDLSIVAFMLKGELYEPDPAAKYWKVIAYGNGLTIDMAPPSNVPYAHWFGYLMSTLGTYGHMIYGTNVGLLELNTIYPALQQDLGPKGGGPSLRLLEEVTALYGHCFSEKPEHSLTLLQVLRSFLGNSSGTFETDRGLDINAELRESGGVVIIDLTAAPALIAAAIIDWILQQLDVPLLYNHQVSADTHRIASIDDADVVAGTKLTQKYGAYYPPVVRGFKTMREFGVARWIFVSFINQIDPLILGNAAIQVAYVQSDPDALATAARAQLLGPKQGQLLGRLQTGHCVVRIPQSGWTDSMLVRTDYLPPSMGSRPVETYRPPSLPVTHLKDLPHVQEVLKQCAALARRIKVQSRRNKHDLSKMARDFLDMISLHPYTPASRLWPMLGNVSPAVQKSVRAELEKAKLVTFTDDRFSSTNQLFLDITSEGYRYLDKPAPMAELEGTPRHRNMQWEVSKAEQKRGRQAFFRKKVPGTKHFTDVMSIDKQGRCRAFECIATCTTNIISHLEACLIESDTIATVTIVAAQKNELEKLRKIIFADFRFAALSERILFEPALTFLKEAFP